MKILLFINSLECGGAERVTANLANYWAAKGWRVDLVTLEPKTSDFYALHPGITRRELKLSGGSKNALVGLRQNMRRVIGLRSLLRERAPHVALAMMTTSNIVLALAAHGLHAVKAVGSERNHPPRIKLGLAWSLLRRFAYCRLAAVVALASLSAEWIESNTNARRVTVIPNVASWPLQDIPPNRPVETCCGMDRKILLSVGRLEHQKGFDVLLDAFAPLARMHPDWDLVIVGEGSERAALEATVASANLAGRVFLPGQVGNIAAWYRRADLYVLSSRFEGFPNTLAEALASGVPAVGFNCDTGPGDIIRHEVDGLLVDAMDIAGMRSALDRLMEFEALRIRYGARALEARERFSQERVVSMWENLFHELLPSVDLAAGVPEAPGMMERG